MDEQTDFDATMSDSQSEISVDDACVAPSLLHFSPMDGNVFETSTPNEINHQNSFSGNFTRNNILPLNQAEDFAALRGQLTAVNASMISEQKMPISDTLSIPDQQIHVSSASSSARLPGLLYSNREEAAAGFSTRTMAFDWSPPQPDVSIPVDESMYENYMEQLMSAFVDTDHSNDQGRYLTELIKDGVPPSTREHLRIIFRRLLDIATQLHVWGPMSLRIYDHASLKRVSTSKDLTFEKRISHMCELMRRSKTRCLMLLRCEDLYMFVAAAPRKVQSTNWHRKRSARGQAAKTDNIASGPDSNQSVSGDSSESGSDGFIPSYSQSPVPQAQPLSQASSMPVMNPSLIGAQNLNATSILDQSEENNGYAHQNHQGLGNYSGNATGEENVTILYSPEELRNIAIAALNYEAFVNSRL